MVSKIINNKKLRYTAIWAIVIIAVAYIYSGAEINAVEGILTALTAFFIGSTL